jgi:ABC-type sugar transport system substrate-binding protein
MKTKSFLCLMLSAIAALLIFPNQGHAQIRTLRIAFNVPNMGSPSAAYALALLQKEAEVFGVTIFPQDGRGSAGQQSGDLMNSVNMGLDAIILEPNDEETLSSTVNDVLASNMPIVTISSRLKGVDKPLCQLADEKHHLGLTEQARIALKELISYVRDQKPLVAAETK